MIQEENNIYIADEGKIFRRKSDGILFGSQLYLGYTWYINGELLKEPKLEVIEDFEEIDLSEITGEIVSPADTEEIPEVEPESNIEE